MASAVNTAKLSARLASRHATCGARRAFHISARQRAAQNYTMPALSPTMTEGNIAAWRVKEGDTFTAGDVILEIETDKATMDVEAQDDGQVFKILQPDGAKGVKVGARIAVMAEEGDDLSSLEVPAEEKATTSAPAKEEKEEKAEKTPERKTDSPTPKKEAAADGGSREISSNISDPEKMEKPYAESAPSKAPPAKTRSYEYPLYPSVQQLLHQNGHSDADASKITATGPNGRLLKGDVLAYLGQISKDYPSQLSSKLEKLTHLDLTHTPAPKPTKPAAAAESAAVDLPEETELAVPISLTSVIATQKRVQDSLGIFLPLSTFIARASELANEDLPFSNRKPTSDDLFNAVLGLDKVSKFARGNFVPQISGISPMPPIRPRAKKSGDIIDLLAAPKSRAAPSAARVSAALGVSAGDNVFSVVAKVGEERRAAAYLERLKMALEKEPGRLVV